MLLFKASVFLNIQEVTRTRSFLLSQDFFNDLARGVKFSNDRKLLSTSHLMLTLGELQLFQIEMISK